MFLLLVVAAGMGIAYGFSSLVDLVENWAGFNGWVSYIIQ